MATSEHPLINVEDFETYLKQRAKIPQGKTRSSPNLPIFDPDDKHTKVKFEPDDHNAVLSNTNAQHEIYRDPRVASPHSIRLRLRKVRITSSLPTDAKFKLVLRQLNPEPIVSFVVSSVGDDYLLAVGKTDKLIAEKCRADAKFSK